MVQPKIREPAAQFRFEDFSRGGMGYFVHQHNRVGQPPFGDAGRADAPASSPRWALRPGLATTIRSGRSSHLGWGTPITAASATSGWPTARFSISMVEIHSPPDLITSLERSVMVMKPWLSMRGDVAGIEPAVPVEGLLAFALEIAARDCRASHFQPAHAFAVAGTLLALVVGDFHFHAEQGIALLALDIDLALRAAAWSSGGLIALMVPSGLISVMPQAWIDCDAARPRKLRSWRGGSRRAADQHALEVMRA